MSEQTAGEFVRDEQPGVGLTVGGVAMDVPDAFKNIQFIATPLLTSLTHAQVKVVYGYTRVFGIIAVTMKKVHALSQRFTEDDNQAVGVPEVILAFAEMYTTYRLSWDKAMADENHFPKELNPFYVLNAFAETAHGLRGRILAYHVNHPGALTKELGIAEEVIEEAELRARTYNPDFARFEEVFASRPEETTRELPTASRAVNYLRKRGYFWGKFEPEAVAMELAP